MTKNPFSHIDQYVPSFERALPFYEKLLPALGFTRTFHTEQWKVFAAEGELPSAAYFAISQDPGHRPNKSLVGFWAADREDVDRIAEVVRAAGGKITDGPRAFPFSPSYYAVYFEDPVGNGFEYMYRVN
jgi:predicted enzyme related to lactoylglutathione lyase